VFRGEGRGALGLQLARALACGPRAPPLCSNLATGCKLERKIFGFLQLSGPAAARIEISTKATILGPNVLDNHDALMQESPMFGSLKPALSQDLVISAPLLRNSFNRPTARSLTADGG